MRIITEEMRYRQKMCEYAIKHVSKYYKCDGNAEVYVQAINRGYKRSFGSMYKQLRKLLIINNKRKRKTSYTKHKEVKGTYPGEKVQVDIKYIPHHCLDFETTEMRYYQITAIDEYSRKRVLEVVDEKSCYNTSKFIIKLEERLGFKIKTIQTDNGSEFVNNQEETKELTLFEKTLSRLKMTHKRTRPYSLWQNGKVERSHRIDNSFYERQEFKSREDMKRKVKRYNTRYNNVSRKVLGFKSPNQIVKEYSTQIITV